MNLFLKIVNWCGVFALAVGCLVSVLNGGFVSALFGVLLGSIVSSCLLLREGRLLKLVGMSRLQRIERVKVFIRVGGVVGCWVLTVAGGLEYFAGALILTAGLSGEMGLRLVERIRSRRRVDHVDRLNSVNGSGIKPQAPTATLQAPAPSQAPPNYTSTVQIAVSEEKQPTEGSNTNNLRIQTPVTAFNAV